MMVRHCLTLMQLGSTLLLSRHTTAHFFCNVVTVAKHAPALEKIA